MNAGADEFCTEPQLCQCTAVRQSLPGVFVGSVIIQWEQNNQLALASNSSLRRLAFRCAVALCAIECCLRCLLHLPGCSRVRGTTFTKNKHVFTFGTGKAVAHNLGRHSHMSRLVRRGVPHRTAPHCSARGEVCDFGTQLKRNWLKTCWHMSVHVCIQHQSLSLRVATSVCVRESVCVCMCIRVRVFTLSLAHVCIFKGIIMKSSGFGSPSLCSAAFFFFYICVFNSFQQQQPSFLEQAKCVRACLCACVCVVHTFHWCPLRIASLWQLLH